MKDAAFEYMTEFYRLQGISFGQAQSKMVKVVLEDNPHCKDEYNYLPVVVAHDTEIAMEKREGKWVAEISLVSVNLHSEIKIKFKKE